MRFPIILVSVFIFCALIHYFCHKSTDETANEREAFWERERAANSTRRKSLDNLNYIQIPLEKLPLTLCINDDTIKQYVDTIVELAKSPIVNLTGISNTDLKLEYGAPNIDLLSLYDSRYTTLASTLQKWASALYKKDEIDAAKTILEFAVSTATDVSGSYKLLADIYKSQNDNDSIKSLVEIAQNLNTPMKNSILEYLNSYL